MKEAEDPSQDRRFFSSVAQLGKLRLGHHSQPSPVAGKEENSQHPPHCKAPPQPVSPDPCVSHPTGDHQWRVGGKGGGDHRGSDHPPRQFSAGEEEGIDICAGALA